MGGECYSIAFIFWYLFFGEDEDMHYPTGSAVMGLAFDAESGWKERHRSASSAPRSSARQRQHDVDAQPAGLAVAGLDHAAMGVDHALRDGQTQSMPVDVVAGGV